MIDEYNDHDDYNEYKDMESSYKMCFWSLVGMWIMLIAILIMLGSCTTTRYIPIETVRTEYKTKTDSFIQKDSIFVKDSVLVESKGDTIHWHHWHTEYKDRWRNRIVIDSFIKMDSIPVPYPVEKKFTRWQQVKIDWGGEAIVAMIVVIFIIIWLIVKRLRW